MTSKNTQSPITHRFLNVVKLADGDTRLDRFLIPVLMALGILHGGLQFLNGDISMMLVSGFSVLLLLLLAIVEPVQILILGREFDRYHAFYIVLLWGYGVLWIWVYRLLASTPNTGKDSVFFYVLLLFFLAVTYRIVMTVFAFTKPGAELLITRLPVWEQILVVLNELLAAGLASYAAGTELARLVQPSIFTLQVTPVYIVPLLAVTILYYLALQLMWIKRWNRWLSRHTVWVRLTRLFAPIALISATTVILYHFTKLSEPRSADILDTANFNQTVLALSPIIWMMIFFIVLLVYTSSRGLRRRFFPDLLLENLPNRVQKFFSTVSDMDILLLLGVLFFSIPLYLFLFDTDSATFLDALQLQIVQQNALIDSSEQALALLFALPFYILALGLLLLYAAVFVNTELAAPVRDELVDKLPIGFLIVFIITLYLCAIPFNIILTEGRLPQLPQELGRVLAFDVLIPLTILYGHYFLLVRIPYGRGQSRWRQNEGVRLERALKRVEQRIEVLANRITRSQSLWSNRAGTRANPDERINMLYEFIELNGERDQLNMERLQIVAQRQQLAEISEAPVSLTIAQLPTRVISIGIPLLLAFKVYEWAVVNDGLREIANNPNIGVIEFFQIILEQLQF